jgi:class 3 adenylate cyclase
MERVRAGDYDARVPVVTSDELGELSHDFNLMALGLAERERMREAFGTYLDRDIVPLILSGRFPREGLEVTVSIMFVDVRGFTAFAEHATRPRSVAALNGLFEVMVPIVGEHGGHIDKFMGDGLLACSARPRATWTTPTARWAAGWTSPARSTGPTRSSRSGVGVNTGHVVAGSIGGAGRLNFSVIGDAVNVSARVEAATRDTGDDMLITAGTRDALTRPAAARVARNVPLKGKSAPVEILACVTAEEDVLARLPPGGRHDLVGGVRDARPDGGVDRLDGQLARRPPPGRRGEAEPGETAARCPRGRGRSRRPPPGVPRRPARSRTARPRPLAVLLHQWAAVPTSSRRRPVGAMPGRPRRPAPGGRSQAGRSAASRSAETP